MSRHLSARGLCLASLLIALIGELTISADEKPPADKGSFGLTNIWSIHLELSAKEYEAMQPAVPQFGGPGGPPQPAPKAKKAARERERNLFGTEFPWAEGDITIDGKALKKVGVRYAGDITYFSSAQGLKRPLKIQFDKFGDQQFNGLAAVHLHSMPLDASKSREAIAFSIFRAAAVPAPRTAFVELKLSVPGTHDREYLGLFTAVENVDQRFLADRFGTDNGLLMKPFRNRGVDFLGDDWERYKDQYRPQSEASRDQAKRVIEFARFVNHSSDADFKKQIESYIDVDGFLRFLAANALVSNLESFFALGHNYHLYLHPKTNKFIFLPGDLEFSLANFLLMGTPDQLMDLSVTKPYAGESKLADRLLAIAEVNEKYRKLVKELSTTALAKEQLLRDVDAIEKATKDIRDREAKAVAARREPPGFSGPGGFGPQAPDLKNFVAKRTESIAAQLAGKRKGYVPQPLNFGPGGGFGAAANNQPIDERTFRDVVQAPPEFDIKLFAAPPKVNSPVAIACEPSGAIYVAVDVQGSLGRTPGGGRIVRCVDKDGDGKVDEVTTFCKVEHPRGVVYRGGSVWVMYPPTLSVFNDDNGDGVSDRQEVLVTGLTTDQINIRGGDHTTNGIRLGIDGWIYIGVGDYGIKEAKGKDGSTIVHRGGGIVRVRPDGTDLEVYCSGLRNPFDIAIDPFMNLFTRDNTNDGAGWDTRVSHLMQTAQYGYTQLFANFTDETMPTLGTFGGGGGTGGLMILDPRWPEKYRTLFTGDWGRSEVYRHELEPHDPTFDLKQEVFLRMPRATGMDIDADGKLYVASWRGGDASVYVGPNVGFVARVTPKGLASTPFPKLKDLDRNELVRLLGGPQSVARLHAQGEILRRGKDPETTGALVALASDATTPREGRVAAIFTLNQLDGKDSRPALVKLTSDAAVRQFALRALTDRKKELGGLDPGIFLTALSDESPAVRGQALISLGRLGDAAAAKNIIPLTSRPPGSAMPTQRPVQNQPDPDRVLPHLAVRALVNLHAIEACLEAVDGQHWRGALWALRYMHDSKAVEGLIKKLATVRSTDVRRGILSTLIRLYHREADYKGSWWGIRPDSTGPYYDRAEWVMSKRIGAVVSAAVLDGDPETVAYLKSELTRHRVSIPGVSAEATAAKAENEKPIVVPKADPKNPNQIGNMNYDLAVRRALAATGDVNKGKDLFKTQSCIACHTVADGQTPKGPHLVDIGKRSKTDELLESILKPSAKLAQGFEAYQFVMINEKVVTGFVVSESANAMLIRDPSGVPHELKVAEIESRKRLEKSAMPDGLADNLTPEQLADLLAYLQSLK
jgi:putative membrane-bound dehydrogenase-like protein